MQKKVVIGKQDFESLRQNDYFYIDKTEFIRDWWDSGDDVTLITRPRRFGKTLNMSMLNCFFSTEYAEGAELFKDLDIWKYEDYRHKQGKYPVIFLSFAGVKADNIRDAKFQIKMKIAELFDQNIKLLKGDVLSSNEKDIFSKINMDMDDALCSMSINLMCRFMQKYYGKKVIILLDEYDTPMQEAYIYGYWDEFTSFLRNLFNSTFKSNQYMERAIMTGITRVSKESMFSDLNNPNVITTTSNEYSTAFGFTEQEVFDSLEQYGLKANKDDVKKWYDGFTFGKHKDIYNPWSIINYLDKKQIYPYWAATSSNGLINHLLQTASGNVKTLVEELIKGNQIVVSFDEQIVFDQLDTNENAIWSLLVAGGYLKVEDVEYRGELREPWYHLSITNLETRSMFSGMFKDWFSGTSSSYNEFVKALLCGDIKQMNTYINDIALITFSNFDSGNHPSQKAQPERFYHGFVLGLLVELRDVYEVKSNRESGYGRYDVMLIPVERKNDNNAIVLEFKVHDPDEEKSLKGTAASALAQIEEKNYDTELIAKGITKDRIKHYGFAFEGKKVLIM